MFDFTGFFESNHIHYVDRGANVARGHINCKCPFCGEADPSEHMSINLSGNGWRCYRNREHAGKNPTRLVSALLGISMLQARELVGGSVFIPDDFLGAVNGKLNPQSLAPKREPLPMPDEWRKFGENLRSAHAYEQYLRGRDFTWGEIDRMSRQYDLRYSPSGKWQGRIIFPVYFDGRLVSWTARTIDPNNELRYKTLSTNPENEKHPAHGPINDYVLWYDDLMKGGRTLVLVEGPFDALKVDVLGRRYGIAATCCFTASPSAAQIELLHDVVPLYRNHYLLLDRGTLVQTLKTSAEVANLRFKPVFLSDRFKDPGSFSTVNHLGEHVPLHDA